MATTSITGFSLSAIWYDSPDAGDYFSVYLGSIFSEGALLAGNICGRSGTEGAGPFTDTWECPQRTITSGTVIYVLYHMYGDNDSDPYVYKSAILYGTQLDAATWTFTHSFDYPIDEISGVADVTGISYSGGGGSTQQTGSVSSGSVGKSLVAGSVGSGGRGFSTSVGGSSIASGAVGRGTSVSAINSGGAGTAGPSGGAVHSGAIGTSSDYKTFPAESIVLRQGQDAVALDKIEIFQRSRGDSNDWVISGDHFSSAGVSHPQLFDNTWMAFNDSLDFRVEAEVACPYYKNDVSPLFLYWSDWLDSYYRFNFSNDRGPEDDYYEATSITGASTGTNGHVFIAFDFTASTRTLKMLAKSERLDSWALVGTYTVPSDLPAPILGSCDFDGGSTVEMYSFIPTIGSLNTISVNPNRMSGSQSDQITNYENTTVENTGDTRGYYTQSNISIPSYVYGPFSDCSLISEAKAVLELDPAKSGFAGRITAQWQNSAFEMLGSPVTLADGVCSIAVPAVGTNRLRFTLTAPLGQSPQLVAFSELVFIQLDSVNSGAVGVRTNGSSISCGAVGYSATRTGQLASGGIGSQTVLGNVSGCSSGRATNSTSLNAGATGRSTAASSLASGAIGSVLSVGSIGSGSLGRAIASASINAGSVGVSTASAFVNSGGFGCVQGSVNSGGRGSGTSLGYGWADGGARGSLLVAGSIGSGAVGAYITAGTVNAGGSGVASVAQGSILCGGFGYALGAKFGSVNCGGRGMLPPEIVIRTRPGHVTATNPRPGAVTVKPFRPI